MTELSSTTEALTRAQVAAFLPEAIQKSLESYHNFMRLHVPAPAAENKSSVKNDTGPSADCLAAHTPSSPPGNGKNPKGANAAGLENAGGDKTIDAKYIKEFADFHKAAKVAISHVELLIKLAKWADLPDDKNDAEGCDHRQLAALLELAQRDVEQYNLEADAESQYPDEPETDESADEIIDQDGD